ncbi:unnamed protein product [Ceratitis capitata]|uniref:(Mediterranean fruit fly) hypothetical protein n=1 Tax=Ceratitis capitata TaxID=7213 RepID=A0A811UXH0_CERCA|nr:unnamed protein product [Ceratitis capitata]
MPAHYLINDRTKQTTETPHPHTHQPTNQPANQPANEAARSGKVHSNCAVSVLRGLIWRLLSASFITPALSACRFVCRSHTSGNNINNQLHQPQILSLSFIHFVSFILFIYLLASSFDSATVATAAAACHSVHMPHFALS